MLLRAFSRGVVKPLLLLTLITSLISPYAVVLEGSTPSVKYQTITWVDVDGVWIIDVSISTELPWVIGQVTALYVNAMLKNTPSNDSMDIVVRVLLNTAEVSSKHLGRISSSSRSVSGALYLIPASIFDKTPLEPPFTYQLGVVVEGFRGGKAFKYSFNYPVTLTPSRGLVRADMLINDEVGYYYIFESLSSINISVVLRNQGGKNVAWAMVETYLGDRLIGRRYLELIRPGEVKLVSFLVFDYFTPNIYSVRSVVSYMDVEGVREEVTVSGIIEVFKNINVMLSSDKASVIEGSPITLRGKVSVSDEIYVVLEKLVGRSWIPINITLSRNGVFTFNWVAEDVDPAKEHVEHVFRARIPLSGVGSNASVVSNSASVVVYNVRRVSDFIADLTIGLEPNVVFRGFNTSITVKVVPYLPVCIPVKITYFEQSINTWLELSSMYVCGEGGGVVNINLPPGKYPVKALITSMYRSVESLPKLLTVLEIPKLLINAPKKLIYGSDIPISLTTDPAVNESLSGYVYLMRGEDVVINTSLSILGIGEVVFKNVSYEGVLTVNACVKLHNVNICNKSSVEVLKPTLTITPTSAKVEVGSPVKYSIKVSPPDKYDMLFNVVSDSVVIHSSRVKTDEFGNVVAEFSAPNKTGSYSVIASIYGTALSVSGRLDVIEFIKSITLELLNKSVQISDKVYAKVTVYPTPSRPSQVIISLGIGSRWDPVAYHMMTTGSSTITFTAPSSEGRYVVKAVIPELNVESNSEVLEVLPRTTTLIPTEYLYVVIGSVVVGGVLIYVVGRRR